MANCKKCEEECVNDLCFDCGKTSIFCRAGYTLLGVDENGLTGKKTGSIAHKLKDNKNAKLFYADNYDGFKAVFFAECDKCYEEIPLQLDLINIFNHG